MHPPDEPVFIEEYNPDWVSWFQRLCAYLEPRLDQNFIRIEHVGSTAIHGMTAKPTIDIDVVIHESDFEKIKSKIVYRSI